MLTISEMRNVFAFVYLLTAVQVKICL